MSTQVLQKKVCLLGAFAVGKTSLVARFVKGIFSEKYISTIGVKIDRKTLKTGDTTLNMMLWDIFGESAERKVPTTYIRSASAYLLVIDGSRPSSIDVARELHERMSKEVGNVPFVVLLNKFDLKDKWQLSPKDVEAMQDDGWDYFFTSALTGENVDAAFTCLAEKIISHNS